MWGTVNPVVLKEVRTNLMLTGGLVHVEGIGDATSNSDVAYVNCVQTF